MEYGNFDLNFQMDSDDHTSMSDDDLNATLAGVDEPSIAQIAPHESSRFVPVDEAQMKRLEAGNQSASTKKNTKWGLKMLKDWCSETGRQQIDFAVVDPCALADLLREFFAAARPKSSKNDPTYHRNSMKNLRAAINRHLRDIGRAVDIVKDREFHRANALLNGSLKIQAKEGKARPTAHKPIIESGDFPKIQSYLDVDSPMMVLYRAWYLIAIHFVSRGLEFHPQLRRDSFQFLFDDEGREYVSLCTDPAEKTAQGGLNDRASVTDKRMYACGGGLCPVETLRRLLEKSHPSAIFLFCVPKKFCCPGDLIWFTAKPLSKRQFQQIMPTISAEASLSRIYTAHSLRATAITALNDAGVELRHIMFLSGHRNEGSIRSYSRGCSSTQKRQMGDIIQARFVPVVSDAQTPTSPIDAPSALPLSRGEDDSTVSVTVNSEPATAVDARSTTLNSSVSSWDCQNPMSGGMMPRGVFNNCTFNIYTK